MKPTIWLIWSWLDFFLFFQENERSPIKFYPWSLSSNLPNFVKASDVHGCGDDYHDNSYQHQQTLKYIGNENRLDTADGRIKRADQSYADYTCGRRDTCGCFQGKCRCVQYYAAVQKQLKCESEASCHSCRFSETFVQILKVIFAYNNFCQLFFFFAFN